MTKQNMTKMSRQIKQHKYIHKTHPNCHKEGCIKMGFGEWAKEIWTVFLSRGVERTEAYKQKSKRFE